MKKYTVLAGTKCRIYLRDIEWSHNNVVIDIPSSYVFSMKHLRQRNIGTFGPEQCIYEELNKAHEVKLSIWVSPAEIHLI